MKNTTELYTVSLKVICERASKAFGVNPGIQSKYKITPQGTLDLMRLKQIIVNMVYGKIGMGLSVWYTGFEYKFAT